MPPGAYAETVNPRDRVDEVDACSVEKRVKQSGTAVGRNARRLLQKRRAGFSVFPGPREPINNAMNGSSRRCLGIQRAAGRCDAAEEASELVRERNG